MINYINENYEKVRDICKIYAKRKEEYIVDDLMSSLIEEFITKSYKIKDDEKFFYIIRSIINLVNNKYSRFNKTYKLDADKFIDDVFYIDETEYEPEVSFYDTDYDFKQETKINDIREIVSNLFRKKEISLIEKNSFMFYFYPEDKINIKNMDIKEIKELRKISYRKLSKRSRKNYQQLRFSVLKVTKLVEKYIKDV